MNVHNDLIDQAESDPSTGGTVAYGAWLIGLVSWDGVLPVCVLATPQIAMSLNADRSMTEFLAVTMPVLAFFVRVPIGFRHIARNHCGALLQCCQFVLMFLAAVFLVCIDALMLLSMEMNNGRLWANRADLVALIVLLTIYLLTMLFVLYPGRSPDTNPAPPGTEHGRPASATATSEY